jgi:3-dehydrocarnitine:acetyl-CoA trimethylamine transferase
MPTPTIISCAVTGNITTRQQHPGLPCTPGRPASMELDHYGETVQRIRDADTDVVINLTTGPGQRFVPSEDDPAVAAAGTTLTTPERRMEHVLALRPEICSLDLNTMYSGTSVVINTPRNVRIMARLAREAGALPELEVFNSGDIHLARDLIADGTVGSPGSSRSCWPPTTPPWWPRPPACCERWMPRSPRLTRRARSSASHDTSLTEGGTRCSSTSIATTRGT